MEWSIAILVLVLGISVLTGGFSSGQVQQAVDCYKAGSQLQQIQLDGNLTPAEEQAVLAFNQACGGLVKASPSPAIATPEATPEVPADVAE